MSTVWRGLSANLEYILKCAARGSLKIKDAKITQRNRHLSIIAQICRAVSSQLRHLSTVGKHLLNSIVSSTRSCNMVHFGPLTAEISWRLWGTPANFNGFRVLALLLHRHRSADVNQTLYDVWTSAGIVHYTGLHFLAFLLCNGTLPGAKFTLRPRLAFSYRLLAALLHGTRTVGVSQTLWRSTRNGVTELSLLVVGHAYIRQGGNHTVPCHIF